MVSERSRGRRGGGRRGPATVECASREVPRVKWGASVARRLARWRVPLGFLFAVAALILSRPTLRSLALGVMVAAPGEALRIWAAGHLEKSREVTRSGPYRLTRHPLYAGSALMGAGLAIASGSVTVAAL